MSMKMFTPINQQRLTNIVVVRLKKGGKRFEIACYPNKVLSWRKGVEKDVDEVLQTHSVFTNVSKGVLAKNAELKKAFGFDDEDKVCMLILEKGELQVSGKERERMKEQLFRDIATMVAEKCVDPATNRPFTVGMVERTMRELHINVNTSRSTKQQALEVIKKLQKSISIARAQMRVRVRLPLKGSRQVRKGIDGLMAVIESDVVDAGVMTVVCLVDPGNFRALSERIKQSVAGSAAASTTEGDVRARVEVLDVTVAEEGDQSIEAEQQQQQQRQAKQKQHAAQQQQEQQQKQQRGGGKGGKRGKGKRGKGRKGRRGAWSDSDEEDAPAAAAAAIAAVHVGGGSDSDGGGDAAPAMSATQRRKQKRKEKKMRKRMEAQARAAAAGNSDSEGSESE